VADPQRPRRDSPIEPSGSGVKPAPRLSVLDTVMLGSGHTTHQGLQATIALAQRADDLGFARYWMAEHHGVPGVASSAPTVMIGAIAAATRRIHVGSGGVMLPNHVPLVVAEQFGTLASLYPGRIDLGVGRAIPEPLTAAVLQRSLSRYGVDDFGQQIMQLAGFLSGDFPAGHSYREVFVSPHADQPPAIWVLGASVGSANLAATLGLPFAFAHHFGRGRAAEALDRYRHNFRPSAAFSEPYGIVTAQVICAPTNEDAERIGKPAALMFLRMMRGQMGLMPSPEEVAAHRWTPEDLAFLHQRHHGQAVGSVATVRAALGELLATTGADELMMTTQMYSLDDRIRTLEQVGAMFVPELASAPSR